MKLGLERILKRMKLCNDIVFVELFIIIKILEEKRNKTKEYIKK